MDAIYLDRLARRRLLELAPLVFRAAAEGDEVSRGPIDELADEIAANASAAVRRLGMASRTFDVILGGGIFRSGDGRFLGRIRRGVTAVAPHAEMKRLDTPPVLGAALMGLAQVRASKAARATLRKQLTERTLTRPR